jgi:hypothetical protein
VANWSDLSFSFFLSFFLSFLPSFLLSLPETALSDFKKSGVPRGERAATPGGSWALEAGAGVVGGWLGAEERGR